MLYGRALRLAFDYSYNPDVRFKLLNLRGAELESKLTRLA